MTAADQLAGRMLIRQRGTKKVHGMVEGEEHLARVVDLVQAVVVN